MKSYRDKPDYKLYKILDDLLTHTSNEEWAVRELREMAENMEDLPE
jgi:hypothetical protein